MKCGAFKMEKTYDNIDDWEIIKEYKKKKLHKLNRLEKDYLKKHNQFKTRKLELEEYIPKKERTLTAYTNKFNKKDLNRSQTKHLRSKINSLEGEIKSSKERLENYDYDIELSLKKHDEIPPLIKQLKIDITTIEAKIKELKAKQDPKRKNSDKKAGETTQPCPKKCRVGEITIACSHAATGRNFTLEVPPHEPGMDTPEIHVISGSEQSAYDIMNINFDGECKHGNKSSAPDSALHKESQRESGYLQYCPRVEVYNYATNTNVHRPGNVKFAASLPGGSIFSSGKLRLLLDLVFCKENAYQEFDLHFNSCKGPLPYKAKVIAHPKWEWNFEMSFGYKESEIMVDGEHNDDKSVWETFTNLFKKEDNTFDKVESNGGWEAITKGGYKYDIHPWEIEKKIWTFKDLTNELGGSWAFLDSIDKFFNPLSGFFELAENKSKTAGTDNEGHKLASVTIHYPNIKISGKAERTELMNSPELGVKGDISFAFAPLFGITGELDLIQLLLSSLGGGFGDFLRKISKMSLGEKDKDGKLNKKKDHIETNLELKIGATSNVSGALGFEAEGETFWKAATADSKLNNATGISGIVALFLTGKAALSGQFLEIKFERGGEFKTADETGAKQSGIEINLKPVMMNGSYSAVGTLEFTGLSIIYAKYKKTEAAGEENKGVDDKGLSGKFGTTSPEENESAVTTRTAKNEKKAIIFSRRPLWEIGDDSSTLGA